MMILDEAEVPEVLSEPMLVFIGGPKDGQRMSVPSHIKRVSALTIIHPQQTVFYDRQTMSFDGKKTFTLFVLDGLHPTDVFDALLEGYKP